MTKSLFIRRGNDTFAAEVACAIVFCVFTFTYLFFYQADLLTMEQHVLSGGLTIYNRTAGAIIITAVLFLLQTGIDAATKKCIKMPAITYFPSILLLSILTDIRPDVCDGYSTGKWLWLAPVSVLFFISAAYISAQMLDKTTANTKNSIQHCWVNLMIMGGLYLFLCATANTDRAFHKRMKIENCIAKGEYMKALQVRTDRYDRDSSTTMLRAFALSKENKLGESLFEYSPYGGSDALLPHGKSTRCLIIHNNDIYTHVAKPMKQDSRTINYLLWMKRHGYAKASLEDYLLCGYLLDRNIDLFAKELAQSKKYRLSDLPKHYREALILYNHIRSTPTVVYTDDVMDTDYYDFQKTLRSNPQKGVAVSLAEKSYGNTYWFYYFSGK